MAYSKSLGRWLNHFTTETMKKYVSSFVLVNDTLCFVLKELKMRPIEHFLALSGKILFISFVRNPLSKF